MWESKKSLRMKISDLTIQNNNLKEVATLNAKHSEAAYAVLRSKNEALEARCAKLEKQLSNRK